MRITVRKVGGFAGISEELASLDTRDLGESRASRISELVARSGFFALPKRVAGAEGADFFWFEITIEDGTRRHTVEVLDDGTEETARLRALVQEIQGLR